MAKVAEVELAARPSINVSDITITRADPQSADGFFTIANVSGGGQVQIERIQMAWQWIGRGGVRADCPMVDFVAAVGPGTIIPGDTEVTVSYSIRCLEQSPFPAREIKNFVAIKLVGRDKIFHSSGSFHLP